MGLKRRNLQKEHLPNFKFLTQFGRELCEEQTQKMRKMGKTDQKFTFLGLGGERYNGTEKSELPKKIPLGSLMKIYTYIENYVKL